MSERGVLSRLLALVHAVLPEDWLGKAGSLFSDTTGAISDFAEEHQIRPKDLAHEGVELARTALHGKANKDLAAAVKDFADAERTKIEVELQRRSLECKLRKEEAETALAELQVVHSEADLLKKLKDLGVVIRRDDSGHLTVLPCPAQVDLNSLAEKRIQEAVLNTERLVLGAILIDNSQLVLFANTLAPSLFSSPAHRQIFESMADLSTMHRDIDLVNLVDHLEKHGTIDIVGGATYVTSLIDDVPRMANIAPYIEFLLKNMGRFGRSIGLGI